MDNTKGCKQLTGFLFDSMIEYLDTKYYMRSDSGCKTWTRLLWWMNGKKLIKLVVEEVRRWADLAGRVSNEVIEWEMSHSLRKWTDFEIKELCKSLQKTMSRSSMPTNMVTPME